MCIIDVLMGDYFIVQVYMRNECVVLVLLVLVVEVLLQLEVKFGELEVLLIVCMRYLSFLDIKVFGFVGFLEWVGKQQVIDLFVQFGVIVDVVCNVLECLVLVGLICDIGYNYLVVKGELLEKVVWQVEVEMIEFMGFGG